VEARQDAGTRVDREGTKELRGQQIEQQPLVSFSRGGDSSIAPTTIRTVMAIYAILFSLNQIVPMQGAAQVF
jgi:hypothetical protein